MKTIVELLQQCNVRLSAGDTWLVWSEEAAQWEVYQKKHHKSYGLLVIRTANEVDAVAAFVWAAGLDEGDGTLTVKRV